MPLLIGIFLFMLVILSGLADRDLARIKAREESHERAVKAGLEDQWDLFTAWKKLQPDGAPDLTFEEWVALRKSNLITP